MSILKIVQRSLLFYYFNFSTCFFHEIVGLSMSFQEGCIVIAIDTLSHEKYYNKLKFYRSNLQFYTLVMFSDIGKFDLPVKPSSVSKPGYYHLVPSYWRFSWRHQTQCVAIFLFLRSNDQNENDDFPLAMRIISNVGHGDTENSIVYIVNPSDKFQQELSTYRENVDIKIPNIYGHISLIHVYKERFSVYCHFCLVHERISWMAIPNNGTLMNKEILKMFRTLTERSIEQNIEYVTALVDEQDQFRRCNRPEHYYRNNITFVQMCRMAMLVYMAKSVMNFTVTARTFEENLREAASGKASPRTPHLIIYPTITKFLDFRMRNTLKNIVVTKFDFNFVHCAPESTLTLLGWQLCFDNFDLPTWFGLTGICVAFYYWIGGKRSLLNFLQPIKIFLVQALDDDKPKMFLSLILSMVALLSMIYQGAMSTDFLSLSNFPELQDLLRDGFRIRLDAATDKKFLLNPVNIAKTHLKLYSKYQHAIFHEPSWMPYRGVPINFSILVKHMSVEKYLLLMNIFEIQAIPSFQGNLFKIGTSFCTKYKYHSTYSAIGKFTWSYMSSTFSSFWMKLTEHGFFQHWIAIRRQAITYGVLDRSKITPSWWIRLVPDPAHYGINVLLARICIAYLVSLGVIFLVYLPIYCGLNRISLNWFFTTCRKRKGTTTQAETLSEMRDEDVFMNLWKKYLHKGNKPVNQYTVSASTYENMLVSLWVILVIVRNNSGTIYRRRECTTIPVAFEACGILHKKYYREWMDCLTIFLVQSITFEVC